MKVKRNHVYVTWLAIIASLGGFLFGYDTAVISGTLSFIRSLYGLDPAITFWIFALFCIPAIIIGVKLVPETRGKTLEEIERHWLKYTKKK